MDNKLKIVLSAILLTCVFSREKICNHLGFGQAKLHNNHVAVKSKIKPFVQNEGSINNYFVNNSIYQWNEQLHDWITIEEKNKFQAQFATYNKKTQSAKEPIEVEWKVLIDIRYRLKYFSEIDLEMFSPIFTDDVKALDGKEVLIEGYVIPFDDEEELLSLSFNPYAACFFCGKASPASVISMYMKNKRKRYKVDEFKKFKGTLHLNQDDPNEFYYILRDAKEE